MTGNERCERVARWVAGVSGFLGLLTATGCPVMPLGDPGWAWLLHPLLLLAGAAAGVMARRRVGEIEARRWRQAEEPGITDGERAMAHREAERARRWAVSSLLLAPTLIGYWLAHQLRVPDRLTSADLLPLAPMLGFGAAWWLAARGRGGAPQD